jgi:hypothetical protein
MSRHFKDQERDERRRARRRPVLETFSIGAQMPALGPHRLEVEDLSEIGVGVRLESDVFGDAGLPHLRLGEQLELKLYLNQSLFIPLRMRIARLVERPEQGQILVGADFEGSSEGALFAVRSFLGVLDQLADSVRMDPRQSPSQLPGLAEKKRASASGGAKSAKKLKNKA